MFYFSFCILTGLENLSIRVGSQEELGREDTEAVRQYLCSMMYVSGGLERRLDDPGVTHKWPPLEKFTRPTTRTPLIY